MTKTRCAIQQCAAEVAPIIAKDGYFTTLRNAVATLLAYKFPTVRFDSEDVDAITQAVRVK